jgi:hypothetical protein
MHSGILPALQSFVLGQVSSTFIDSSGRALSFSCDRVLLGLATLCSEHLPLKLQYQHLKMSKDMQAPVAQQGIAKVCSSISQSPGSYSKLKRFMQDLFAGTSEEPVLRFQSRN